MAVDVREDGADQPPGLGQIVQITARELGFHEEDSEYEARLEFDLGNLMASDPSPLDAEALARDPQGHCLEIATRMTQVLVGRLFKLPTKAAPEGRIAQLPEGTTRVPRAKPLPKPREPTRWEKFAARKGIVKHKRSRLVFDEQEGEWRRRHGYKRAHDIKDIPIIEARSGDQVGEDPFSQMEREKKERVKTNSKRQLANLKANAKAGKGELQLPPTLKLAAQLPQHGKGRPTKRKELHPELKEASRLSGVSTASMGKFDERLPGEKPGERQVGGRRRKFMPLVSKEERPGISSLVDRIVRERADDILDVGRAVGKVEAERREARRVEKLAAAEQGGAPPGKGKGKKHIRKRGLHRAPGAREGGEARKGKKGPAPKGAVAKKGRAGGKAAKGAPRGKGRR
eukprot:jgi/Botrbrau1/14504/Bobra.0350s0009.1